ncbi:unnamed protein product [Allacma fusca]|uniref:Uncharacterized protein n=1 Tax=Allacma fusca TaxID=39272 RepID=A0A8J2KQ12_9HEXA|nr:unnamed protein product [Allacma fusca]
MRLLAIVLFFSALVAATLAAPAVERDDKVVEQLVEEAEPTTQVSISDVPNSKEDELAEDATALPAEEATTLPSTRDGRQIDDEASSEDDPEDDDDDDDEEEEDEEEEEEEAARNQAVKPSKKSTPIKNKHKTAEKPIPVLGEGGVEDDEAEDLGLFEREEPKSDEKASDEKESEEDPKDEQEDEEEESNEDEERDEPAGKKPKQTKRPKQPPKLRERQPISKAPSSGEIHPIFPVVGNPPTLEDVGQGNVGEQDLPIIRSAVMKNYLKLAPSTSSGAFQKYHLRDPSKLKRKKAGLIDINGKKKVYVEYDDGTVQIVEDAPTLASNSKDQTKKHSVFHEVADFFFDLVGNRKDFIFEDLDDEEDHKPEDSEEKKDRSLEESEETFAPDGDEIFRRGPRDELFTEPDIIIGNVEDEMGEDDDLRPTGLIAEPASNERGDVDDSPPPAPAQNEVEQPLAIAVVQREDENEPNVPVVPVIVEESNSPAAGSEVAESKPEPSRKTKPKKEKDEDEEDDDEEDEEEEEEEEEEAARSEKVSRSQTEDVLYYYPIPANPVVQVPADEFF